MASSPQIKVYTPSHGYIAAFKFFVDAAIFVAALESGATVRVGHSPKSIVWEVDAEDFSAGDSYDRAADVMAQRAKSLGAACHG